MASDDTGSKMVVPGFELRPVQFQNLDSITTRDFVKNLRLNGVKLKLP